MQCSSVHCGVGCYSAFEKCMTKNPHHLGCHVARDDEEVGFLADSNHSRIKIVLDAELFKIGSKCFVRIGLMHLGHQVEFVSRSTTGHVQ